MRVYHRQRAGRPLRVLWTLEEIGEPYELIVMDKEQGAGEEHRARHPLGRVPAIDDGEGPVFESAAICMHLGDLHPGSGLMPQAGSHERALVYQWAIFAPAEMETPLFEAWTQKGKDDERAAAARARFDRTAAVVLDALKGAEYLVGGQLTIADVMVATALLFTTRAGYFEELPQELKDYTGRLGERPAFQRAITKTFG